MARRRRDGTRARQKGREAAASLLGLGGAMLLLPLFMTSAPMRQVFVGLRPMALLMLLAGIVLVWWQSRQRGTSDAKPHRTSPAPARSSVVAESAHHRKEPILGTAPKNLEDIRSAGWSMSVFEAIEWRRFEAVVEALFRQAGFITKAKSHGPDGGVDVWLYSKHQPDGSPVSLVQCKHWQGKRVGVDKVRELRGVMAAHNVRRGQFATTSEFTPDAEQFAKENGINLLNMRGLLSLIGQRTADQQTELLQVALEGEYWKPTCASCGIKLIERTAKSGVSRFWGCDNYPRCRTTMPVRSAAA